MLVNGAGVSPSQAPIEAILKVDLYGTAVLLEEVGKVIAEGGCGVTISSQSGWRMPQLTAEEDEELATTPTEELLELEILQPENIKDTLHAYQMAKRCNEKRVMAQSVEQGKRGARLNDIAPKIIVTPLAIDEFNGPRGDFYKNMFAKCPAGRPGTADEVANVAELLMSDKGAFITGSTFLIDGGATSSYYYGPLKPEVQFGSVNYNNFKAQVKPRFCLNLNNLHKEEYFLFLSIRNNAIMCLENKKIKWKEANYEH